MPRLTLPFLLLAVLLISACEAQTALSGSTIKPTTPPSSSTSSVTPIPDGYFPAATPLANSVASPTIQALQAELDRVTHEELAHGCVETDLHGQKVLCGASKSKVDSLMQQLMDAMRQAGRPDPEALAQAMANIRDMMDDPALQLTFRAAVPNPDAAGGRMMVTFVDDKGRYYQVDGPSSTVIQFGPLPSQGLPSNSPHSPAGNLREIAEAWLSKHIANFPQVQETFSYSEGSKGTTAAFRWDAPSASPAAGMPAFVQVVLTTDGAIVSFQDTRVLNE